jgi:hypothetical protein
MPASVTTKGRSGDRKPKQGKAMLRKTLCSVAVAALIGSAAHASEIHRVVTTLDANNKSRRWPTAK